MKNFIPLFILYFIFTNAYSQGGNPTFIKGSYKKFEFINNTGRDDINDLHFIATVPVDVDGNSTKFDESNTFQIGGAKTTTGETVTSFDKFKLSKGKKATVWLRSDSADIQIKKWWWTVDGQRVGPERKGTVNALGQRDAANQDRDLVGHDEDVSGYKFKNPVPKPTKNTEFGVNDLHIITLKKPVVVNAEKKDATGEAKVGGKFPEDQNSITECDCTRTYNRRTERSCYELCKMDRYKGKKPVYIINLKTDETIPFDSTVTIKLKGKGEVKVEEYFWTRDGKPIDFNSSGQGRIRDENDHRGSLPKKPLNGNSAGRPEHMEEISYQYFNPFGSSDHQYVFRSEYGVGVTAGTFAEPTPNTSFFGPADMMSLQEMFYDPGFMELLQKQIFQEDFSGNPSFIQEKYSMIMLAELYVYYRLSRALQVNGFVRASQQKVEAKFDYLYNDLQTDAIFSDQGSIQTELRNLSLGAGVDFFPWQHPRWEPFIGLKAGYQLPLQTNTDILMDGHTFPMEKATHKSHLFGAGQLGIQYHLPKGFTVGATIGAEYHLHQKQNGGIRTGGGLRISKSF